MFKLPSVRGFPRTSNTAQVCEQVEDSRKGRQLPAQEIDLGRLFPSLRKVLPREQHRELDRTPTATVDLALTERKLYIPTGERHKKKDGTLGAEHKIPFILVTVTATIMHGKHAAFFYRVTNRSTKVFDSRTGARVSIADMLYELHRICPPAIADSTADALAEWLQPERDRKPRPRKPTGTNETANNPPDLRTVKRAPFSAKKHLIGDSVLAYLSQPLPFPDVKIA